MDLCDGDSAEESEATQRRTSATSPSDLFTKSPLQLQEDPQTQTQMHTMLIVADSYLFICQFDDAGRNISGTKANLLI